MKRFPLLLAALFLALAPLRATQTDNHGIHAVPAPARVTIDGQLAEWDLSGAVLMCYDLETMRDTYSAQVAMMHDAEALYVAILALTGFVEHKLRSKEIEPVPLTVPPILGE